MLYVEGIGGFPATVTNGGYAANGTNIRLTLGLNSQDFAPLVGRMAVLVGTHRDVQFPVVATKTTNYTLTAADSIILSNGTDLTVTLPDPGTSKPGTRFTVNNINATALTVASVGTSRTIDGAANQSLAQWAKATVIVHAGQWYTV